MSFGDDTLDPANNKIDESTLRLVCQRICKIAGVEYTTEFYELVSKIRTNTSVLQDWLVEIPIRMQSTLILGLRGPDGPFACPEVKRISRWLRGVAFKPGNPKNCMEFMGEAPSRIMEKSATAKELEFCSQHYYSHLMHALEVVGYKHPDIPTRMRAFYLFSDMCALMHLPVECAMEFDARLEQKIWPGGKQPDTYNEAVRLLEEKKWFT